MAEDKNETDKKDEQQTAAANVLPAELSKEMRTSFLEYSMSVIVSRALPDVEARSSPHSVCDERKRHHPEAPPR